MVKSRHFEAAASAHFVSLFHVVSIGPGSTLVGMKQKTEVYSVTIRTAIAILMLGALAGPAHAQWLGHPTNGIPRTRDGQPDLSAPAPRTREGKADLSGLWLPDSGPRGTKGIGDTVRSPYFLDITADMKPEEVPFQPWAAAEYKRRVERGSQDDPTARCQPTGVPALNTYPMPSKIIQTPELIVILYENNTDFRQIFVDGRSQPRDPNPTWMGYSVGRWEGDALVVDSNGYTDRSWLDFGGHPHTESLRITERYTRTTVGRIDMQVTMTDPKAYARPIRFSMPKKLQADTELLESVCENNAKSLERMTAISPATPVQVPAATLTGYVGTYDITDEDGLTSTVEVTMSGSTLWLEYAGKGKEALVPLSPTRFSWSGTLVDFATPAPGAVHIRLRYVEGDERGPKRAQ